MPRQPRQETIVVRKPIGGWGLDFSQSNSASIEVGKNQYARSTGISFYRPSLLGHIAPGESYTAITDSGGRINELPLNGDVASNGKAFTVLRNGRLVRIDLTTVATDANYSPSPAAPNHNTHTVATSDNQDVIILKVSGTERVFMRWEDDVDADIMRINPDGTSQDDDWFSTLTGSGVLTKGVPGMMTQGTIDNDLFGLNGQYVFKADLSAGTGNPQALNLGEGWIGASIERAGNYIAITGYRSTTYTTSFALSKCRTWLWDGVSDNPNFAYDIEDNYVTRILPDLSVITQGQNNTTKFQRFTGDIRQPYKTVFQSAQIGNAPRHGSVGMFQGMPHWGRPGGESLFCMDGDAFHYRSVITDGSGSVSDVGMVKNLTTNSLFIGVKISSTYKIFRINYSGYNTTVDYLTGLYPTPYKANITGFTFFFSQFGTGASLTASVFKDYNNISIGGAADFLNRQLTNAALSNVSSFYFPHYIYDVNSFFMNIRFDHASLTDTAAIIREIHVYIEEVVEKF
jgi:hypothetical protein